MNTIPAKTFFYWDKYWNTRLWFTTSLERESDANIYLTKETFDKLKWATLDEVDDILWNLKFNTKTIQLVWRKI
jgi:hypothetical protein